MELKDIFVYYSEDEINDNTNNPERTDDELSKDSMFGSDLEQEQFTSEGPHSHKEILLLHLQEERLHISCLCQLHTLRPQVSLDWASLSCIFNFISYSLFLTRRKKVRLDLRATCHMDPFYEDLG